MKKSVIPFLNYFQPYLQFDALPAAFFEKNKDVYINIIERTIRYDLLYLREIDASYVDNAFRLIKVVSTSSPGELSYSGLSSSLGIGIKITKEIVNSLARTGLIYTIAPHGSGKGAVRKEENINASFIQECLMLLLWNKPVERRFKRGLLCSACRTL